MCFSFLYTTTKLTVVIISRHTYMKSSCSRQTPTLLYVIISQWNWGRGFFLWDSLYLVCCLTLPAENGPSTIKHTDCHRIPVVLSMAHRFISPPLACTLPERRLHICQGLLSLSQHLALERYLEKEQMSPVPWEVHTEFTGRARPATITRLAQPNVGIDWTLWSRWVPRAPLSRRGCQVRSGRTSSRAYQLERYGQFQLGPGHWHRD